MLYFNFFFFLNIYYIYYLQNFISTEINFQKVNASKVFFSTKIYFQGPKIKPSPAVRGPAEYDGFWNAVQGKTLFNFSFKLPHNAPNSFSLMNNNANVKYIVTV